MYEEIETDEVIDTDISEPIEPTITREPIRRKDLTKEYYWYEYLFIGLGVLSFLSCLIYLIFFLKRRKDENEKDKYDEKKA